jgi:hypothetical protein
MAFPIISFADVVILPVKVVLGSSLLEGVKVAVVPLYETVPATEFDPSCTVNDVPVIVEGFICSLKVAVITFVRGTLVAPFIGSVDTTTGHTPTTPTKSSFLHPAKNTIDKIAMAVSSFFFFILLTLIVNKIPCYKDAYFDKEKPYTILEKSYNIHTFTFEKYHTQSKQQRALPA